MLVNENIEAGPIIFEVGPSSVEAEPSSLEAEASSLEDEASSLEGEPSYVKIGPSSFEVGPSSLEVEPPSLEEAVVEVRRLDSTPDLLANQSANVHVDPKIVNNTVHSNRATRGRWLGPELVSPEASYRMRCCIFVFVIVALISTIIIGLTLCFTMLINLRIDIGLDETWYLRRHDWQAQPPSSTYNMKLISLPVHVAIIGHSVTRDCKLRSDCISLVKEIQQDHLERFDDIGPNYLVGGVEGYVFEGRGANVVGAGLAGSNSKIISFMFLGDYTTCNPNQNQLDHVAVVLRVLVKRGVLNSDYILYGYCQLKTYTISPGPNIMKRMAQFSHWSSTNATYCLVENH